MKNQKFSLKVLAVTICSATPLLAQASLDSMTVHSQLSEPFSATIALSGSEAETVVSHPSAVSIVGNPVLRAQLISRNGRPALSISSSSIVKDPIVSFTLKVGDASRKYSALMDPPRLGRTTEPTKVTQPVIPATTPVKPEQRVASSDIRLGQLYVTQPEDTVISIARRVQQQCPSVTLNKIMDTIVAKNPRAFVNGNRNILIDGAKIRIPSQEELQKPVAIKTPKKAATPEAPVETPKTTTPAPIVRKDKEESKLPVEKSTAPNPTKVTPTPAENANPVKQEPVAQPTTENTQEITPATSVDIVTPAESSDIPVEAENEITEEAPPSVTPEPAAPVAPPQQTASAPQTQPAETGFNLMQWLPYIGGGLAALLILGGLLIALKKSKKNPKPKAPKVSRKDKPSAVVLPKEEDFASIKTKDIPNTATVIATSNIPQVVEEIEEDIQSGKGGLSNFDFGANKKPQSTEHIATKTKEEPSNTLTDDDFIFDLATDTPSHEKGADKLVDGKPAHEYSFQLDFENTEPNQTASTPDSAEHGFDLSFDLDESKQVAPTPSSAAQDDFDLSFDLDESTQAVPTSSSVAQDEFDLSFDLDESTQAKPTSTPAPSSQDDFDFLSFDESAQPSTQATAITADTTSEEFDLSLDSQEFTPTALPSAPKAEEDVFDFSTPEQSTPTDDFSIDLDLSSSETVSNTNVQEAAVDFASLEESDISIDIPTTQSTASSEVPTLSEDMLVDDTQESGFEFDNSVEFTVEDEKPRRVPSVEDQLANGEKQKLAFDDSMAFDLDSLNFSAPNEEITAPIQTEEAKVAPSFDSAQFTEEPVIVEEESALPFDIPAQHEEQPLVSSDPIEVPQKARVSETSGTVSATQLDEETPLLAKLELAKMYISMGDNEGVSETLMDILATANKDSAIFREAEALLSTVVSE